MGSSASVVRVYPGRPLGLVDSVRLGSIRKCRRHALSYLRPLDDEMVVRSSHLIDPPRPHCLHLSRPLPLSLAAPSRADGPQPSTPEAMSASRSICSANLVM